MAGSDPAERGETRGLRMSGDRVLLATGGGLAGIGGIWAAVNTAVPNGVQFSSGALAISSILLVALVSAIISLFGLLLASKDVQIAEWKRLALRGTDVADKALTVATQQTPPGVS